MSTKSPTKNTPAIEQLISDSFDSLEAEIQLIEQEAEKALKNPNDLVKMLDSHSRCLEQFRKIEKKRNELAALIASLSDGDGDDVGGNKP